MSRRLTSTWPGVGFVKLNREPADGDRVLIAREVAEGPGSSTGAQVSSTTILAEASMISFIVFLRRRRCRLRREGCEEIGIDWSYAYVEVGRLDVGREAPLAAGREAADRCGELRGIAAGSKDAAIAAASPASAEQPATASRTIRGCPRRRKHRVPTAVGPIGRGLGWRGCADPEISSRPSVLGVTGVAVVLGIGYTTSG
jgi:hypothetical protein